MVSHRETRWLIVEWMNIAGVHLPRKTVPQIRIQSLPTMTQLLSFDRRSTFGFLPPFSLVRAPTPFTFIKFVRVHDLLFTRRRYELNIPSQHHNNHNTLFNLDFVCRFIFALERRNGMYIGDIHNSIRCTKLFHGITAFLDRLISPQRKVLGIKTLS